MLLKNRYEGNGKKIIHLGKAGRSTERFPWEMPMCFLNQWCEGKRNREGTKLKMKPKFLGSLISNYMPKCLAELCTHHLKRILLNKKSFSTTCFSFQSALFRFSRAQVLDYKYLFFRTLRSVCIYWEAWQCSHYCMVDCKWKIE